MAKTSYAIGFGSNRRHGRFGGPVGVIAAAVEALRQRGMTIEKLSRTRATPALGPAGRSFANAAAIVSANLDPVALLGELKAVERAFGRRGGRRWGPRVLDLDILLWTDGMWSKDGLRIPHPGLAARRFVLEPLAEISPDWREPRNGRTIRQLLFRHRRARPVDPHPCHT